MTLNKTLTCHLPRTIWMLGINMFVNRLLEVCVVSCFTWRPDARAPAGTSAVTSCRTSPAVFEFECCFSIKGCKPLISSAVLQEHQCSVRYCYYSSLVNQRARDQTISHHTRWKLKQLNMNWVTQTYSTTFSYFGVFFPLHCWSSEFMKSFFLFLYKDTTTFDGMRMAWSDLLKNALKWNQMKNSTVRMCSTVKDEDGNYHLLHSFRQEG